MNLSNGRIWPYAISASIIFIFGAGIATIVVSTKLPVEISDTYMMSYQEADAKANEIITARIAFNKKYKIEYLNKNISTENTSVRYRILDINSNPINNAKVKLVVTRPNNHKNDQEILNPTIENGIYTFSSIKLPLAGRWDFMAKVEIDSLHRFYNIKADTRKEKFSEY